MNSEWTIVVSVTSRHSAKWKPFSFSRRQTLILKVRVTGEWKRHWRSKMEPAAAGNSNLLPFDSNRSDGTVSSSSHINVFPVQTLRRLLLISVSVILSEIIQFICQVCLIMQSRRLSVSAISAVLVIWTLLALTLTAQWVILLSSNRVAMYTTHLLSIILQHISIPIKTFQLTQSKKRENADLRMSRTCCPQLISFDCPSLRPIRSEQMERSA